MSNLLNRVLICLIFVLLAGLSAGLGVASRQAADARVFNGSGNESFGSAGSDSFGSAPGTSTFGAASGSEAMGSAPAKKKKSSPKPPTTKTSTKKKTSSKKTASQKSSSKPAKQKDCKKPAKPAVTSPVAKVQPTPQTEEKPEVAKGPSLTPAKELPTTGPGQTLGLFAGTSLAGFAGHKLYLRRKS